MAQYQTPATNKQLPDHSIFDYFGKQTYLGNTFSLPVPGFSIVATTETPVLWLQNPTVTTGVFPTNWQALFVNLRRISSASTQIQAKFYFNPTVNTGIQTVVTRTDVAGNLNSTYWTFYAPGGVGYYVWYSINSAGVDPAPPGLTGIKVSGATGVLNTVIATATKVAIDAASTGVVASISGHTVTLTNQSPLPFTPAADSTAAPTGFTFAVTAGPGSLLTPIQHRPANLQATSIAIASLNPITSANGTLVDTLEVPSDYFVVNDPQNLLILDPGQSLLMTLTSSGTPVASTNLSWYQL